MIAELVKQVNGSYFSLSVFLISASIFLGIFACAAVAVTRMIQLYIATNLTITRELSAIRNLVASQQPPSIIKQPPPRSEQTIFSDSEKQAPPQSKNIVFPEGEIIAYDDEEMADHEAIRILRAQKKSEGGMDDDEWQAEIDKANAAGFKAETV